MRVFFSNLGCKLNQAEIEGLRREFVAAGFELVDRLEASDLHVINSCTVTHRAARDSRKLARRGARLREEMRTVLTGCYATASEHEARGLEGVDLVVTNVDKARTLEKTLEHLRSCGIEPPSPLPTERAGAPTPANASAASSLPSADDAIPVSFVPLQVGNARAALKVEDGCNMKCSFCIIPSTRGRQQSLDPEHVLAELRSLSATGFAEVVVTGVQISSYRHGDLRLYDLARRLLDETDVARLRLSSIAPWQFDERILDLFESGRLCRHFHLSLQSGCDATLRRMRRPYTATQFAELVTRIRDRVPGVAITTDVIVGFPGETDEEFDESLAAVESLHFARTHAFSYSPREGTGAFSLPHPVAPQIAKERMQRMLEVSRAAELEFWQDHVGQELGTIWESASGGELVGVTDNYIRVRGEAPPETPAPFVPGLGRARLLAVEAQGVRAEVAVGPRPSS